jgi:DNA-binding IscR family transcriptional regulator
MLNTFVDDTMADLTRAEMAVWLVLFRDVRDGTATVSQDDLARRAGVNARNIRRALARLRAVGLVELVRRGGLSQGASCYRVRASPTRRR